MSPKLDQPKSDLFNYFTNTERWSDFVAALKLGARKFVFFFLSTPAYMNSPFLFVLFLPSSAYFNSSLGFMSVQISLQISRWIGSHSVIMFNEILLLFKKDDGLEIWVAYFMVGKEWRLMYLTFVMIIWKLQIMMAKRELWAPTLLCLWEQEAVNKMLKHHFVMKMLMWCVKILVTFISHKNHQHWPNKVGYR